MTLNQLIKQLQQLQGQYGDRRVSIGLYGVELAEFRTEPLRCATVDKDGGSFCLSPDPEAKDYADFFFKLEGV